MIHINVRLLIYAAAIFFIYFYFGIIQETITRGKHGKEGETFEYPLTLVFITCVINYIFAKLLLTFGAPEGEDTTRPMYYASSALTYLLAMVCSNMALQWVNYPTQVVGKSCKPIPVMILGVFMANKSYPLKKYLYILMIVTGVVLFIYKDGGNSKSQDSSWMGELLLVLSLLMDGLTSSIQERMRSEHASKAGNMMMKMNLYSSVCLAVAVFITGEFSDFLDFASRNSIIWWHISTFAAASAIGQLFIFRTVSEFGPLPCSIITTTRKFFTVLASVAFMGNTLTQRQWIGTLIVFAGLIMDSMSGKKQVTKS